RVIVDLSVEDDDESTVSGFHGLMARGRQVHDRESPMPQPDCRVGPHARVVGTTPAQTMHGAREFLHGGQGSTTVKDADDATHQIMLSPVYCHCMRQLPLQGGSSSCLLWSPDPSTSNYPNSFLQSCNEGTGKAPSTLRYQGRPQGGAQVPRVLG